MANKTESEHYVFVYNINEASDHVPNVNRTCQMEDFQCLPYDGGIISVWCGNHMNDLSLWIVTEAEWNAQEIAQRASVCSWMT